MERCKYCGAGYGRKHDEMIWFRCGSYHGEVPNHTSGRGAQCYSNENELLKDQLERLRCDVKKLETYITYLEIEFVGLNKKHTSDSKALADMMRILEAKP